MTADIIAGLYYLFFEGEFGTPPVYFLSKIIRNIVEYYRIFCLFASKTVQNNSCYDWDLTELLWKAKSRPVRKMVVAAAEDEHVLQAIQDAIKEEIIVPVLVGDKEKIDQIAQSVGIPWTASN